MTKSSQLPKYLVVGAVAAGVAIAAWRLFSPGADAAQGEIKTVQLSEMAAAGKVAFDANCAKCHGANGSGTDKGPPLIHDIYNPGHHSDEAFYRAATQGTPQHHWPFGDMPPQPQVSKDQIESIVRYVREVQEANGIFYRPHRM